MTAKIAVLLMLRAEVAVGGAMLCAEGRGLYHHSQGREELAAIAQVAINRSRRSGRTVLVELTRRHQFALRCPLLDGAKFEHLYAGVRLGVVGVPSWADAATNFVAPHALHRVRDAWMRAGLRVIPGTDTVHVFWAPTTNLRSVQNRT